MTARELGSVQAIVDTPVFRVGPELLTCVDGKAGKVGGAGNVLASGFIFLPV